MLVSNFNQESQKKVVDSNVLFRKYAQRLSSFTIDLEINAQQFIIVQVDRNQDEMLTFSFDFAFILVLQA